MATEVDLQRLVVQMEASFTKYQREWQKALGTTDANVKQVQTRFDGMSKSIGNAGANTARALDPIAGQTGNIAAQFQDIAVQLQGGQSPFLIAMQQGTQLSAVLSQSKSPIAALSAGFMQMVNPISLATIAAIALGGAAVQYLGSILGDGKSAEDLLKEHNETIRGVAEKWGEAVPALKAYVDQLDRAADEKALGEATEFAVKQQYEDLIATVGNLRGEFASARTDLQQLGATAQDIDAVQAAFDDLERKARAGTATAEDINRVLELVASTTAGSTTPAIAGLAGTLGGLSSAFAEASRQAAIFREQQQQAMMQGPPVEMFTANQAFVAEQERINGLTAEQLELENEIARVKSEAKREEAPIGDAQALAIAKGRLSAEERRAKIADASKAAAKSGSSAASEAEREREAVLDLIEQLEYEQSVIGMTQQQKEVANALRRAGAAATDEERQAITDLVNATYLEQEALQATAEQMEQLHSIASSAIQGLVSDLMDGKDAGEALGDALEDVANRLISSGLDTLLDNIFNSAGGSSGGNIFTAIAGMFGVKAATGGRVSGPGTATSDSIPARLSNGEFVVNAAATKQNLALLQAINSGSVRGFADGGLVAPRMPVLPSQAGSSSAAVSIPVTIHAPGADAEGLARVEREVRKLQVSMPSVVKKTVRDMRKYGQG